MEGPILLEGLADVERLLLDTPDMAVDMAGGGGSATVWSALCEKMVNDMQKFDEMSPEEKEQKLRTIVVPIPGLPPGRTIRLLENPDSPFTGGTGCVLWPAALALIELLDREVGEDRSLRAVELGAGLGSAGIFLAKHRGLDAVVTDRPEAMKLLERNVGMNFCEGAAPKALVLQWGDSAQLRALGSFDLVVGSDITYRPDCLDDLVASIQELLRPGGRAFLTLQDRTGEAALFRAAVARQPLLQVVSHPDVRRRLNVLPEGAPASEGEAEEAEEVTVKQFELIRAPTQTAGPGAGALPSSPDEVEAEFERLTGIRPERMVPAGTWARQRQAPEAAPPAKASLSKRIADDLKKQGLGDYLDGPTSKDPGKLLGQALAQEPLPDGQRIADIRDAAASGHARDDLAWENACASQEPADRSRVADGRPPPADATAPSESVESAAAGQGALETSDCTAAAVTAAAADAAAKAAEVDVVVCLSGLTWQVDVDEAESRLSAVVTFGEEVWQALRGAGEDASADAAAFRDSVDFQMADEELQVLHAGAPVLHLRLRRPVDPHAAAAKLCSRRRRVTVRAPLRGPS